VPANVAEHPALVVILHGCTQTAGGYDDSSGWSRLADVFGFVVLYPEQRRENNANLCFNWFVSQDIMRDSGEALSIRELVAVAMANYNVDRSRIYISGLSAGGAMTNVMLATYPEVFAGGAIIAGLPYGTASTVPEAFDRMRGHGLPQPDRLRQ
jgi:poly(hydroxyalkanoate) depolymerase family esterase